MIRIKFLALWFLWLISCENSFSQDRREKKWRSSQITLSVDNGIIFNNASIVNNGSHPDPIRAPEAIGYRPGVLLEFQRTTSYGLLFGGGLCLGNYRQDFDVVYDTYDFLDTSQIYKEQSSKYSFRNQSLYWGVRLYVGYSLPVKSSKFGTFSLEAKVGLTLRKYFKGGSFQNLYAVSEIKNDTIHINKYLLTDMNSKWGSSSVTTPLFFDFNIGLKRDLNRKPLSSVAIGIFATMKANRPGLSVDDKADGRVRSPHYKNGQYDYGDMDHYIDRDIILGIRASFGLKL